TGDPQAKSAPGGQLASFPVSETGVIEKLEQPVELPGIVTSVQGDVRAVYECNSAAQVWKLPWLDEVAFADRDRVHADAVGEHVKDPLDHKAGMRTAAPAVRRNGNGVGEERFELDVEVGYPVGTGNVR